MWCKTGELKNMRLIDIDNLKEQIDILTWYHINSKGDLVSGAESREKALYKATDIYMLIDNAPTVDIWKIRQEASENGFKKAESLYKKPQGKWIGKGRDSRGYCDCFECSNCGAYIYPITFEKELDYNGCPYCFADMRGEDNE